MGAVLAGSWALVLVALGLQWQPRRARAVLDAPSVPTHSPSGALAGTSLVERAGMAFLRVLRRPEDPVRARQLGGLVSVASPLAVVYPRLGLVAALVAIAQPVAARRRAEARTGTAVLQELPEVVDLLSVAVAGGLTVSLAVAAVAERVPGLVGAEFSRCITDASLGRRLADELDHIPSRLGDASRPLIRALVAAERYGTPIVDALAQVSADVRTDRRRQAEIAARRLPVKLLFPLVVCVLPAFVLLTVVPILAGSLDGLGS